MACSLFLVDDHPLIRDGIKSIIASDPDYHVSGEASCFEELKTLLLQTQPDIMVLDIVFDKRQSGYEILQYLAKHYKNIKILILTMLSEQRSVKRAFDEGASGYLLKGDASESILAALKAVAEGKPYYSPSLVPEWFRSDENDLPRLTQRENEVVRLLGEGCTAQEISRNLSITASTVGSHMENIKYKLNISSMNELIRISVMYVQTGKFFPSRDKA